MRAAVWTAYGAPEVLDVRDVETPVPGSEEILVRIHATTVTAGDVEMRGFAFRNLLAIPLRLFFGLVRPRGDRVLGQELAGDVVAVGEDVTRFGVGDRVFAQTGFRFGGYAEYSCLPQDGMVARIPAGVSYEAAATIPTAGLYGLYFVRRANIEAGQRVLVNGGAGSIGTYAIQLARRAGAVVSAIDRGDKADFLHELGVEGVVDYTAADFADGPQRYDVIMDVIDKSSFSRASRILRPGGVYLHSDVSPLHALRRALHRAGGGKRSQFVSGAGDRDDLGLLAGLMASGELRAVIDRRYRLDEIVAAHRYAESGAKKGHIVVSVVSPDQV